MEITGQELQEKINNGEKLIVDFHAAWCGPCKMQKPIYEKVSKELQSNSSNVKLYTMDVDKNRETVLSLGIRNVPTIKSFNNGKEVYSRAGVLQEFQLHELAKNLLNG